MQVIERTLPHSLDAERSILGAILVHGDAFTLAAQVLVPEDFFRDAHTKIFRHMSTLREKGTAIDWMTLREELTRNGEMDEVGGPAYVSSLSDGVPRATNVAHYAAIVKEKAQLRAVIYAANEMSNAAYEQQPANVTVESGVRKLMSAVKAEQRGVQTIGEAVSDYMRAMDSEEGVSIPTGLVDLDELVGGLQRKKLTIIAARPSVGKTSLAVAIADHVSKLTGPVGMFSLETDNMSVAAQLVASYSGVPSETVRRRTVGDNQWESISYAVAELGGRPFYLLEGATTMTQIQAWARRLRDDHGVRLIVVDYIQLVANTLARDMRQEVAHVSRSLKILAQELDVAVVALSQLSRSPEGRADKRPQLSDLRESGALEQDADLVFLLFREEMHKATNENAGVAEIIVAKNRSGPVGVTRVRFMKQLAKFCNLASE